MKRIGYLLFLFTTITASGQAPHYTQSANGIELVTLTPKENINIPVYNLSGIFKAARKIIYIDSGNTYQVYVPKWLKLRQNNDVNFFGGTLPPVNTVENAIVISAAKKTQYKSFQDFKNYIIEDTAYLSGKAPKWDTARKFLSVKKDLLSVPGSHSSYKVSFNRLGSIFVASYLLVETKTSYLWIQFIATGETYPANLPKFREFLQGFSPSI
ncbi:MAG: hypothetical protein U0U70_16465 [Chitinophagaceae bacterium]